MSANLGVSYSIANVLETAGAGMIARWLPAPPDVRRLTDDIYEKMALPTTLPELPSELALEQAAAREALRLALEHHVATALPPPGRRTGEAMHRLLHGGLEEPVADPAGVKAPFSWPKSSLATSSCGSDTRLTGIKGPSFRLL